MTTQEAIETILGHHAVEEVTKAETSKGVDYYWIMLKEGHTFGDDTNNWLVGEWTMKNIATLIAI